MSLRRVDVAEASDAGRFEDLPVKPIASAPRHDFPEGRIDAARTLRRLCARRRDAQAGI